MTNICVVLCIVLNCVDTKGILIDESGLNNTNSDNYTVTTNYSKSGRFYDVENYTLDVIISCPRDGNHCSMTVYNLKDINDIDNHIVITNIDKTEILRFSTVVCHLHSLFVCMCVYMYVYVCI